MQVNCPYCNEAAILESSRRVYSGRDYGLMYICSNYPACDSYVGIHKGTAKPLGRLANKELRYWKIKAHAAFDELWKRKLIRRRSGLPGKSGKSGGGSYKKGYARGSAYKWLAEQLGIRSDDCHIGMFDVDKCKKVVDICALYLKDIETE